METITINQAKATYSVTLMETLKQARSILLIELAAYPSIRDYDLRGKRILNTVYKINDQITRMTVRDQD